MLNVLDFTTGVTHSVSLTSDSNAFQVASALSRNKPGGGGGGSGNVPTGFPQTIPTLFVFYNYNGTTPPSVSSRKIARRLRSDTRPLNLVNHMRRALLEPMFLVAPSDVDEAKFKSKLNIELDTSDSGFFSLLERLTQDDWCGYVDSREGNEPYRRTWWVLCGEKLWHASSHMDSQVVVLPLAQNRVVSHEYEIELHTVLSSFHLRFSDPREANLVYRVLSSRVISATENEYLRLAECLISDLEHASSVRDQALITRASSSLDGLLETVAGEKLFARFARRHGYESLLLFYLDAMRGHASSSTSGGGHDDDDDRVRLLRRFAHLAKSFPDLAPGALDTLDAPTVHSFTEALERTRKMLLDGPYAMLQKDVDARERLLQELPLWKALEDI